MSDAWRFKCPSCGELMGAPSPYKTITPFTAPDDAEPIRSDGPEPEWLARIPVSGYKFKCECGCTVDVPADRGQE